MVIKSIILWKKKRNCFLYGNEINPGNHTAISRGFCIGKKNWRMIDTVNGVKTSAMIYSIAETAKANNLKSYEYFEYLLEEIPKYMYDTDRNFFNRLLPWSLELPEHIRKTK